jgi:hypothetical protein
LTKGLQPMEHIQAIGESVFKIIKENEYRKNCHLELGSRRTKKKKPFYRRLKIYREMETTVSLRHVPKNFQAIPFQINAKNWIFKVLDSQISIYQKKGPSLGSSKRAILSFQDERCPSYEHRKRTISIHVKN